MHLLVDGRSETVHTTAASVGQVLKSAGFHPGAHDLVAPSLSSPVPADATIVLKRGRLLKLDIDGTQRFVWTTAPTVAQALDALGFTTSDFSSVSRSRRLPLGATDIALRTPKRITVVHDGIHTRVTTTDATVGQLLKDMNLDLGPADRLSTSSNAPLVSGQHIRLTRVVQHTRIANKPIPYATKKKIDPSLPAGTTKVVTPGRKGMRSITWSLVYVDGSLVGKVKMASTVVRQPVDQVERIGALDEQPSTSTPNAPQAPLPDSGIRAGDREEDAAQLRVDVRPVQLPRPDVEPRERLAGRRREPERGIRHPAGAARLEDGLGRAELADRRDHPDQVGPRLHQGALQQPVRGMVALAAAGLVLARSAC